MKLKKGYTYEDGVFKNAEGEEVTAAEAIESTDSGAESAAAEGETTSEGAEEAAEGEAETSETASESETEEGTDETKALISTVKELVQAEVKKLDAPKAKSVNIANTVKVKSGYDRMSKEEKFKQFIVNVAVNDRAALKAANNTTAAGALIPPAEFIAEVQRLEEEYGVARANADVRTTDRTSIQMILGDDDLEVSIVGEGAFKPSKKIGYSTFELTFRKGVGILPVTDELLEDSAVNIWNDAVNRAARAYARKEDEFVFTDATSGIENQSGIYEIGVDEVEGTNGIGYDEMSQLLFGVPSPSMRGGKYYMNHKTLGVIHRLKDDEGRPLWMPGPNGPVGGSFNGVPVVFTEVLPSPDEAVDGDPLIIFGDLRYVTLADRTGMRVEFSNSAIVGDPDLEDQSSSQLNSWTNDLQSMRFVKRFNSKVRFPEAFAVLRLGAVS